MKKIIIFLLFILIMININAQDDFDSFLEDNYPFEEPDWNEEISSDAPSYPEQNTIGGNFEFTTTSLWQYPLINPEYFNPLYQSFKYNINFEAFLDLRTSQNFRTYASSEISYPFKYLDNGNLDLEKTFSLNKLFIEFNWGEKIFFKAGKQSLFFGEGNCFSPNDLYYLLSIASKDDLVSLITHIPIQLNDFYLYLLTHQTNLPHDMAIIPKIDLYFGFMDLSLAAYYRYGYSPKIILYNSIPVFNARINCETVFSYGSDKNFIVEKEYLSIYDFDSFEEYEEYADSHDLDNFEPELIQYKNKLFIRSFIELVLKENNLDSGFNYKAAVQFFYNGEGYEKSHVFNKNRMMADLKFSDEYFPGRYYLGMELSTRNLNKSGLGFSISILSNLSDFSFDISPKITYEFNKDLSLSLSCPMEIGDEGDEFTLFGQTFEPKLSINLFNNTEIDLSVPLEFTNKNGRQELENFPLKLETTFEIGE